LLVKSSHQQGAEIARCCPYTSCAITSLADMTEAGMCAGEEFDIRSESVVETRHRDAPSARVFTLR
jgi:hypothetical protein